MRTLSGMVRISAALALALAAAVRAQTPTDIPERYSAWLESPGGRLRFGLELSGHLQDATLVLINGDERIEHAPIRWDGETLSAELRPYDAELRARRDADGALHGTWRKRRGAGASSSLPFFATPGIETIRAAKPARVGGRWAVRFEHDVHPAVGVFVQGPGPGLRGTFLTTLGDYRYLAGHVIGDELTLSCFDGAHAFLFEAELQEDGTLAGHFWSGDTWRETWSAVRDEDAQLPDAFALTSVRQDVDLESLRYPDLDGELHGLGEGPRILHLFGTWCPNCNDASKLLAELDARFRTRGLTVVGLAFEHAGGDAAARVREYRDGCGATYPVLLAGPSDKGGATAAFPLLDRVLAYPTTLFVDRAGQVRAVHTGFSGPATGPEHERLRARFEELAEELLR